MNKTFHSQIMKMYETVRKNEELKLENRKMEIKKALHFFLQFHTFS